MVVKMTVTGIHNSLLIAYAPISTSLKMIRYYAVLRNGDVCIVLSVNG